MSIERPQEKLRYKSESHFITVDPEGFITEPERKWARNSTVATIGPMALPLDPELRTYGGTENVDYYNSVELNHYGLKQIKFGHPLNRKTLDSKIPGVTVLYPPHIDESEDLLTLLRTDRPKFEQIELLYALYAFQWITENRDRISVVQDHTVAGRPIDVWLSQFSVPVIRTEHGPLRRPSITPEEDASLEKFGKKTGVEIVSISNNQRRRDWNYIGTVYNGIHMADFKYQEKKSNYLLILGRVCFDKGVHNAIEIAQKAGMQLVIAGKDEGMDDYFERYIAPAINDTVNHNIIHYAEGVGPEKRKELLSGAQALLAPNEWDEPFGMMMAEALASGTPVVGYNRGSIPEVVGENLGTGFVVNNNVDEAVDAVQRIKRGEFSPWECRARAELKFSAQAMAAHYLRVYMEAERRFYDRFRRAA